MIRFVRVGLLDQIAGALGVSSLDFRSRKSEAELEQYFANRITFRCIGGYRQVQNFTGNGKFSRDQYVPGVTNMRGRWSDVQLEN